CGGATARGSRVLLHTPPRRRHGWAGKRFRRRRTGRVSPWGFEARSHGIKRAAARAEEEISFDFYLARRKHSEQNPRPEFHASSLFSIEVQFENNRFDSLAMDRSRLRT